MADDGCSSEQTKTWKPDEISMLFMPDILFKVLLDYTYVSLNYLHYTVIAASWCSLLLLT